jgi:hypothetical protein
MTLSAAVLVAAGAAAAHGGFGPGAGGCGAAPAACGAAGAPGHGAHGGAAPAGLMTPEEMAAHRAKMASLASVDECRAYLAEFGRQVESRAKERGTVASGPSPWMCDRMQSHGRFTH